MLIFSQNVPGQCRLESNWLHCCSLIIIQRIRGAIDSTIAQEQARQRQGQASPSRSNSNVRRADPRAISPAKRILRQGTTARQDGDPPAKGPDPTDFESEFAIDVEDMRRSSKPQSNQNGSPMTVTEIVPQPDGQEANETSTSVEESSASLDLPTDVRDKLRKLEKYESRYHGIFGLANHPRPSLTAARAP